MKSENTYDLSFSMAAGIGTNIEESGDFTSFLQIRMELNQFLLSLNYSNHAEGAGQQIHFLFLALEHLDNVDREIRISNADPELINLERIHTKIRSLKMLILGYIRHLSSDV